MNAECEMCKKIISKFLCEYRLYKHHFCSLRCAGAFKRSSQETRFWKRVKKTKNCWLWTGCLTVGGYGNLPFHRTLQSGNVAHRFSYELRHGKIPNGKWVLHTCDNRRCVKPDHLYLGTFIENARDCVMRNREAKGEKNGMAKFTEQIVRILRKEYATGKFTKAELAKRFNMSYSNVQAIITRFTWKHL